MDLQQLLLFNHVPCMHAQSHLSLCDSMDCSLQGSSAHGISQARILNWVAIFFSRGSSHLGIEPTSPAFQADFSPLSHQGSHVWQGSKICHPPMHLFGMRKDAEKCRMFSFYLPFNYLIEFRLRAYSGKKNYHWRDLQYNMKQVSQTERNLAKSVCHNSSLGPLDSA